MKKIISILIILIIAIFICFNIFNMDKEQYDNYEDMSNIISQEKEIHEVKKIKIHIAGAVNNPGVKEMEEESRIIDVIDKAGGLLDEADIDKINLAYKVEDEDKIYIPTIYEKEDIINETGTNILETVSMEKGQININKASRRRFRNTSRYW